MIVCVRFINDYKNEKTNSPEFVVCGRNVVFTKERRLNALEFDSIIVSVTNERVTRLTKFGRRSKFTITYVAHVCL